AVTSSWGAPTWCMMRIHPQFCREVTFQRVAMGINQILQKRYSDCWTDLKKGLQALDASHYTNPFLIVFDEEKLAKSDLKVMIFGQETRGWGDKHGWIDKPENTLDLYDKLFCQQKFYRDYKMSSFWKAFRYF